MQRQFSEGPSPKVPVVAAGVVVAIVDAATIVVVGGGGLLGECGECGKTTAAKRAFHVNASLIQRCKGGDRLDAEQSPS